MKPLRVGIVGGINNVDKGAVRLQLEHVLNSIANSIPGRAIEIVAGLTDVASNNVAYAIARERRYTTVGIACERAREHPIYPCDRAIVVTGDWGAEDDVFLDNIDVLVRVGGGKQSQKNALKAQDRGIQVMEYGAWPKRG